MSGYLDCPACTNHTAVDTGDGKLRCIPCGHGLVSPGNEASPEQSRANADFLSGRTANLRHVDGSSARGKRGN